MPAQNASCMLVFLILHLKQNQLNMTLRNNTEKQNYIGPLKSINLTTILPCENFILNCIIRSDFCPSKPAKSCLTKLSTFI